jgi:hypothetical protein
LADVEELDTDVDDSVRSVSMAFRMRGEAEATTNHSRSAVEYLRLRGLNTRSEDYQQAQSRSYTLAKCKHKLRMAVAKKSMVFATTISSVHQLEDLDIHEFGAEIVDEASTVNSFHLWEGLHRLLVIMLVLVGDTRQFPPFSISYSSRTNLEGNYLRLSAL